MAPSQNIMMRINSPGTTSFCWRPSQGSASAFPPQTLSIFSSSFPLFITDTLVFVPCHPLMGSSAAVAAYRPSLGLLYFLQSLCSTSLLPSLSAHLLKFPLFQDPFFFSSYLLLPVPSAPLCSSTSFLPS